jgi:hypothetical protein
VEVVFNQAMTAGSMPPFSPTGAPTAPLPPPRNDWRGRLLVGLAGVVVGGVVVGAAWLAVSALGGGSTAEIALPDKVAAYPRFADAKISQPAKAKPTVERIQKWNAESAKRLSASFGGAAAAVESYSDDTYQNTFTVYVVRESSQFPVFVRYQDPEVLRVVRPQDEERRFGEVSCQVVNDTTPAGQQPGPESVHVIDCRRTEPGLTVDIVSVSGDLGNRPAQVAALVDDVWSRVS